MSSGTRFPAPKATSAAIALESGLSNLRYTVAMARGSAANSATSEFFINTVDNVFLDTSSSNNWTKYAAGAPDLEAVFRQTLHVIGPRRLLFGTDSSFFPRGWVQSIFAKQTEVLAHIGVSRDDAAAILGGTLLSLQR